MKVFDVGPITFRVDRLKVKQSLKGLQVVGAICGPALGAAAAAKEGSADAVIGGMVSHLADNLDRLPELLDMFVPVTTFTNEERKNPTEFKPFLEDLLGGRPDYCLQYLAKCVEGEYGSFFSETSPIRGYLAKAMEKYSASLQELQKSGPSGES